MSKNKIFLVFLNFFIRIIEKNKAKKLFSFDSVIQIPPFDNFKFELKIFFKNLFSITHFLLVILHFRGITKLIFSRLKLKLNPECQNKMKMK